MRRLSILIVMVLLLSSCDKKDDIYNVNKKISNMLSYSAVAEITILGNKGGSEYKVKQFFIEPDKIRIETIEPEFLKGKVIVYNGEVWEMYHPMINSKFKIENLRNEDEYIYLGMLQKSIAAYENVKYEYVTREGIEYVAIKCNIPGGNEYRRSAILYMTRSGYYPEFMEILDNSENIKIRVRYLDFEYNCKLEEELFQLD